MKCLLWIFCLFLSACSGYKILIFSPTNSMSHLMSNARIADTLASDGHDVTILEAEFRVKSKPAKLAKKVVLDGFDPAVFDAGQASLTADTFVSEDKLSNHLFYDASFFDAFNQQCDAMLTMHKDKLAQLASEKFDIIFAEQLNLCGVGLKEVLKIKSLAWISSCPLDDHMAYLLGVPTPLSYVPSIGEVSLSDKMTFRERLQNILEFYRNIRSYWYGMEKTNEVFRKHYGQSFPSVIDLARDADLTFVLADEFLDFPRPVLHNTIFIGGVGLTHKRDGKFEYLDKLVEGMDGIVFFSVGTNIETKTMPAAFKINFFKAVSAFPKYRFILKFDKDDEDAVKYAKGYRNIEIVNWVDQPAVLSDSRVKLFITHGGYNSLVEAANYAKPIMLMPLFGDQWRNAQLAQRNGLGLVFEKKTLLHSPTQLISVLRDMLSTDKYEISAKRMQKLVKSKPLNATERLLKYTRFLLDNEGNLAELQIEGRRLSLFVYYNLDIIIAAILLFTVFPLLLLLVIIRCVFVAKPTKPVPKKTLKKRT